ncbi:hypothetical protein DDZ13_15200 [Coraliomargarita sinensis]|uniref:Uncharacterized protein n=2 Tax=Coraliomargarita sinensis TaxID=2174842 RepID=A0A317ZF63_9BACT|nr:hypothetical protein DDZ13_15200 [Coraliomargarita sinensis]
MLDGTSTWENPKEMEIYIEGKLWIKGNHRAITNPTVESGIIHSRVLLEFLGLRADLKNGTIEEVKKRKPGDIGIEMFQHDGRHLERVTKEEALSKYPGRREDAERSLVITIAHAHRSIAHLTEGPIEDPGSIDLLILGAKGVLALVHDFLYVRLGIPTPDYSIKQIKP